MEHDMKQVRQPPVRTYGVAILTSLIAVAITQTTVLNSGSPFLLPIAAILLSAWLGGVGPGLVATVITLLANTYLVLGPTFPLRLATVDEAVRLSVFGLIGLGAVWLAAIRERAEAGLREQRELLRVTLSSIGDAVVATDAEGSITFINPIARSLTGWTQDEVADKPLTEVLHIVNEQTGNPVENPVTRVIRKGAIVGLANHSALIAKDGTRVPIDDSAAPIRDAKGDLIGAVLVFHDVTERRRAEQALQESEERYRTVTEAASDAIVTIDQNDQIVFANRATQSIFGYPLDELQGRDLTLLMSNDQRDAHGVSLKRHLETGERSISWEGVEFIGRRRDGKTVPLEVSLGKFVRNGQPYFTGILRDITERKQAEKRQAAQYAVTRALAESDTLSQAAPKILQAVCESADWQVGAMWTLDRNVDLLRCLDVWHLPDIQVDEFEALTREMLFAPGLSLPGRVWQNRTPAWISDVTHDPNFLRTKVAVKNNLHGAFAFPIGSTDETTGVIEFFSPEVRSRDDAFLQLMTALGSQIGQFVERKRAEEALRQSREQQAIILAGVADGITAQNQKGRLIYANDAAARLIGYPTPQALLDAPTAEVMRNFQLLDDAGQPVSSERLPGRLALRGEPPEPRMVHSRDVRTGEEHWSLVNASPVLDEQGKVQFAVNIFHDVTERRRAEEDRLRLAAIVESSEDAIISKTVDGVILSWNLGATRLYGYTAGEAMGQSMAMLYPPERRVEFEETTERLKRGEPTPQYDTVHVKKNGGRIDVSVSISAIKDSAGHVIRASTIVRDITERKRAEETQRFLSEASSTLASSLDYEETLASVARLAVPQVADWCAVDILGEDGTLQSVALAHIDPQKVKLAQEFRRRYPPEPDAPYGVHNVLRTGKSEIGSDVSEEQITAAARDVEQLKLFVELDLRSYIIAPLIARRRTLGALTLVSGKSRRRYTQADVALAEELAHRAALSVDNARLYHDAQRLNEELEQRVISRTIELQNSNRKLEAEISERKEATERLRMLSAHLQSAREEERIRIAREIHDELGQVLTAIKIDLSLLSEKLDNPAVKLQRRSLVEEVNSAIKLIDQTIQEMRHIIRELRPEILDHLGLGAAIEWQVQEFQTRTGIECEFHSNVDDERLGLDHATAVFRILQEALTNVARHAQATRVDISLKEEVGNLLLEVRDNGKGIAEDDLSTQKTFGIVGMRERALAFDGAVDVERAVEGGTRVLARIPIGAMR
jgi:PAS domain S-box-containing protein